MARSSAGGPGHAGLILILLGLATASCGYIVGVVAAWARCGDAAVAPHSLCLGGLPFLAVILDGQRCALHDRLARTRVVTGAS